MKFGSGSLTGAMFGSVRVRFGWSSGRVCFELSIVARSESDMGQLEFVSSGIQFNVGVNIGSGVNRIGYKSSRINFELLYVFNVAIFSSLLLNCI